MRRALALLAVVLCAGGPALRADEEEAVSVESLRARFDDLTTRAVEKQLAHAITNEAGGIAWGTSYVLAALVERMDATRDPRYARLFVRLGDHVAAARDHLHDRKDHWRQRACKAWGSTKYTQGRNYVWAVHTGMVAAPLARFAAIVRTDETLRDTFGADGTRLLKVAAAAVAVHDDQWQSGPAEGEGYLTGTSLGRNLPLNMQNGLGRAWIHLDEANSETRYRDRILGLARYLKRRLRASDDGAYAWAYDPGLDGKRAGFEDISHAAINVDFAVRCQGRDLVFTADDLERFERTLLGHVVREDETVADTVGGAGRTGRYVGAVYRWGRLGHARPAVHARLWTLYREARVPAGATEPLALALLLSRVP